MSFCLLSVDTWFLTLGTSRIFIFMNLYQLWTWIRKYLSKMLFQFYWKYTYQVELLDHVRSPFLIWGRPAILFSIVVIPFNIPATEHKCLSFPTTSSPTFTDVGF
jgi:hypothetical protein